MATVPKTDSERWNARAERFGVSNGNGLKSVSLHFSALTIIEGIL